MTSEATVEDTPALDLSRPGAAPATTFEPVVIGFTCNWCSYRAADLAGISRVKYPPNIRLVRLMCSGRLDPTFVLKAFASGADGVLVSGCWPGECHYIEQNYYALRRFQLLQRTLAEFGFEPGRLKLVWASAAEGVRLAKEIGIFVEEVRALGPLDWGGRAALADRVVAAIGLDPGDAPGLDATVAAAAEATPEEVPA